MSVPPGGHSGPVTQPFYTEDPRLSEEELGNVPQLAEWALNIIRGYDGSVSVR
jgi:hypothetical protein